MIDKQIIIHGVDVSGCSNLYDIEDCICIDNGIEEHCKDKNCYYKQLKRAEQKLEKIKEYCKPRIMMNGMANVILQIMEGKENGQTDNM